MSEQTHATPEEPEPTTMAEAMGLEHLAALGVSAASLAALLAWRRAVRRGTRQVAGPGTEPQQERLRWK